MFVWLCVQAGYCLISGVCYAEGATSNSGCYVCATATNVYGWTIAVGLYIFFVSSDFRYLCVRWNIQLMYKKSIENDWYILCCTKKPWTCIWISLKTYFIRVIWTFREQCCVETVFLFTYFKYIYSKLIQQSTTNTSRYVSIERLLRDRWHVLHRHDRQVHGRVLYDVCRRHHPDGLDTTGFPLLLIVFCFSISSLFCRFPLFVW